MKTKTAIKKAAHLHKGSVTKSAIKKVGREVIKEVPLTETPSVQEFETDSGGAYVTASLHITKNLGNMEFAKVGMEVRVPCSVDGFSKAKKKASALVRRFINEEFGKLDEEAE